MKSQPCTIVHKHRHAVSRQDQNSPSIKLSTMLYGSGDQLRLLAASVVEMCSKTSKRRKQQLKARE